MGALVNLRDRLVNLMSGAGTTVDKASYRYHVLHRLTDQQIEAGYRSSWLMRRAVDLPPYDMTRAGRDWQAKADQIEKLEAAEKALGLWDKLRQGLVLGRLGGGGMVLYVDDADQMAPLNPDRIRQGALRTAHVWHRTRFSLGQMIDAWDDPWFGHPSYYEVALTGARGSTPVRFHPSRVIAFKGNQVPDMITGDWVDCFWGDSLAQSIQDAVNNADAAQAGFATLIEEAKVDIIKMPGLMQNAATTEYEQRFMERFRLANLGKSTHRALVIDAEEEWDQRQVNWAGMKDIILTYVQLVAGASGIPATRLLGKSPDGMNATGEGDEKNWRETVSGMQENELRPAIERVDSVLIPSTLGTRDPDISWAFAPLSVLGEEERARVAKTKAETTKIYADIGIMPAVALEKGVQNQLIEDETYPGLDGALAELSEEERFPSLTVPDDTDPSAIQAGAADPSSPTGRKAGDQSISRAGGD